MNELPSQIQLIAVLLYIRYFRMNSDSVPKSMTA
jgi:hypothetical protein